MSRVNPWKLVGIMKSNKQQRRKEDSHGQLNTDPVVSSREDGECFESLRGNS